MGAVAFHAAPPPLSAPGPAAPEPLRFRDLEMEIFTTFDGVPDPFARSLATATALQVTANGVVIKEIPRFSAAQMPIRLPLTHADGKTEYGITAIPPATTATPSALRVVVREGAALLFDQSVWSNGSPLSMTFQPAARRQKAPHDH